MARAAQRAAQPRSRRAQLALRTTSFRLGSGPTNGKLKKKSEVIVII